MAALSQYTTDLQATLNDPLAQFYTSSNLNTWINRARSDTAKASGCLRVITPSTASVAGVSPVNGGTGYTSATVAISGPNGIGSGFIQATATATVSGGAVTGYTITNAGSGYVTPPTVTIAGNGTGATAAATIGTNQTTTANQESYSFAALSSTCQLAMPGVQAVYGVANVAVSQGAVRPQLAWVPWASMQAYMRGLNQGPSYPQVWSQFGRDENGSLYLFPVPMGAYEMQADCYCTPQALSASQTIDLIPDNLYWAAIYRAAYYAYISAQRKDDANAMKEAWREEMAGATSYAFPGRTPTFYDEN